MDKALIPDLLKFMLELQKGFANVIRVIAKDLQQRILPVRKLHLSSKNCLL